MYDPLKIKEQLVKIKDAFRKESVSSKSVSTQSVQVLKHNNLADLYSGDLIKNIATTDNVYTKPEVDQKILDVATGGGVDLGNYYTKPETDQLITNVNSSINTNSTNLSNYMTSNNNRLTTDETNITALQTDNTTNKANITSNTSNISSLTTRMNTAEGNITTNASAISNTYTKAQSDSKYALLGAGSTATWGQITGTLSNQTDLNTALTGKLDKTGGTLTGGLTLTPQGTSVYIKYTGQKTWVINRGATDNLNFAPTTAIDGTSGDWTNQIIFTSTGGINANSFTEGGTNLSTKYQQNVSTAWTTLSLQNSWIAMGGTFATPSYRLTSDGSLELKGVLKSGTMTSGTTVIANLPAGYRPNTDRLILVSTNDGTNDIMGRVHIRTSGDIVYYKGGNAHMSFDNVRIALT